MYATASAVFIIITAAMYIFSFHYRTNEAISSSLLSGKTSTSVEREIDAGSVLIDEIYIYIERCCSFFVVTE